MKFKLALVTFLITSLFTYGQFDRFDALLKTNVSDKGVVNYEGIISQKEDLQSYISYLEITNPDKNWSKDAVKSFWINAYNAYTIKLIIDNYPLKSILNITDSGKDAWHQKIAKVGGNIYTLNDIEHDILRKDFSDPRIHVGVNCASYSCPPLPNYAFNEKNVDAGLEKLMRSFVNDSNRNIITSKKVTISKIFDWYKKDFTKKGSLISYIQRYSNVELSKKAKVKYMDYNWTLNE